MTSSELLYTNVFIFKCSVTSPGAVPALACAVPVEPLEVCLLGQEEVQQQWGCLGKREVLFPWLRSSREGGPWPGVVGEFTGH